MAPITSAQSRDTGMAMVLLCLLVVVALDRPGLVVVALVLQVAAMTAPGLFRPVAVVWLGLARGLGAVVSRVLLAVIYFGLVTPVGLLRRALGKDDLQLRAFKTGDASVLTIRDHTVTARDLERPY